MSLSKPASKAELCNVIHDATSAALSKIHRNLNLISYPDMIFTLYAEILASKKFTPLSLSGELAISILATWQSLHYNII